MSSLKFQDRLLDLQDNLLNFAYMLTANREEAKDLLQDTTLKALDNEDKYIDNVNFKGWVFTIMRISLSTTTAGWYATRRLSTRPKICTI